MMAPAASPPRTPAPTAQPTQCACAVLGTPRATMPTEMAAARVSKVFFIQASLHSGQKDGSSHPSAISYALMATLRPLGGVQSYLQKSGAIRTSVLGEDQFRKGDGVGCASARNPTRWIGERRGQVRRHRDRRGPLNTAGSKHKQDSSSWQSGYISTGCTKCRNIGLGRRRRPPAGRLGFINRVRPDMIAPGGQQTYG